MEIYFTLEHQCQVIFPCGCQPGEMLDLALVSPIPSTRKELSSGERAGIRASRKVFDPVSDRDSTTRPHADRSTLTTVVTPSPRLDSRLGLAECQDDRTCFCAVADIHIRVKCERIAIPLEGVLAVGRKDSKDFPGETPTRYNQEDHRESRKIICPKDFNKS